MTMPGDEFVISDSPIRRAVRIVIALVVLAALGTGAYVVYKLATERRGKPACDRIAELGTDAPRLYDEVAGFVESLVVTDKLVSGKERVKIGGEGYDRCLAAFDAWEKATGNRAFTKVADCVAKADSSSAVQSCLRF